MCRVLLEAGQNVRLSAVVSHTMSLLFSDVLFGQIYDKFNSDPIAKGTFLECLEVYMLDDRLTDVSPPVMKVRNV